MAREQDKDGYLHKPCTKAFAPWPSKAANHGPKYSMPRAAAGEEETVDTIMHADGGALEDAEEARSSSGNSGINVDLGGEGRLLTLKQ